MRWEIFKPHNVATALVVGFAVGLGTGCTDQESQRPPVSGPRVPGVKDREQAIPIELQMFMQKLQQWRNSLSEGTSVSATFYPDGIEGIVESEIGVNRREFPTDQARRYTGVPWGLPVGTESSPARFKLTITWPDATSDEWIGENENQGYSPNSPSRYGIMDFSISREKDEVVIKIVNEPQNSVTVDFPRKQAS